ncbi:glycerol uptake facilitator [Sphaerulina musiva SO2202]|uniref:Glycerol uptake facilitator n=1 Tax=Sphaerulina musiva (strain SO2202) TaxID=692275 RepID=M3D433_SPHMS|nr:glycerol uptake facilitator [Sphaerulina musiva SO2202]EMF12659.1 glycerol uptake facilitator [Sphaerulina musiva SO2202]
MGDMGSSRIERLHTNDLELGATEAVQQHFARHVVASKPVSQRKLNFEHSRPRWLRECMAEATGVFFYVFAGISATTVFTINQENAALGSIFQIGAAFALGIAFAIITCASTSGGHFNPAITICFAIWQGFPWRKVPHYIFSQILGAFIAGILMMGMYHQQLSEFETSLREAGHVGSMVFNGGPASVLCSIPNGNQTNLGYLFFIEFFVDAYIGIIIWAVLDPANPFVSASSAPFAIGLGYATMIWGWAPATISTNLARDLGTRIVAAIFYGGEVFSFHNYSWIAILVNIPATIFATAYYEFLMRDSLRKIGKGAALHEHGEEGLALHLTKTEIATERGMMNAAAAAAAASAAEEGAEEKMR